MISDKKSQKSIKSADTKKAKKGSGRFKKGKSGNAKGRPLGSRNKVTLMAQALFDGEAEKICLKIIDLALKGESLPALQICLNRILPPVKSAPISNPLEILPLKSLADVVNGYSEILNVYLRGDITSDEVRVMQDILEGARRAMETASIAESNEIIEGLLEEKNDTQKL